MSSLAPHLQQEADRTGPNQGGCSTVPWPTSVEIERNRENQTMPDQEPKDLTDLKGGSEAREIRPPSPARSSPRPTETTRVQSIHNELISTQPVNRPKMTLETKELHFDRGESKLLCFRCCFWFTTSPHQEGSGIPHPTERSEIPKPPTMSLEPEKQDELPRAAQPVLEERPRSRTLSEVVAIRSRAGSRASHVSLPGLEPRSRKGSQVKSKEGASGSGLPSQPEPRSRTTSQAEPRSRRPSHTGEQPPSPSLHAHRSRSRAASQAPPAVPPVPAIPPGLI